MPKQSTKAEFNVFVKGLLTEASPLNFPENASFDEQNFELSRKGTRARRLGMALEPGNILINSSSSVASVKATQPVTFRWNNAGGDENLTMLVTQFENRLYFFDLQTEPLSASGFLTTITLNSFPTDARYSFASIDGTLVIAAGIDIICIVTFDNNIFHAAYERILVRDTWGVEEQTFPQYETDISYRGDISSDHYYNLLNQSWGITRTRFDGVTVDPAWSYFADGPKGVWPSNSEIVWPGIQFKAIEGSAQPFEHLYLNIFEDIIGADVKAPKGYFVIDLLRRGTSREEEVANNYTKYPALIYNAVSLPDDYTPGGATIITDFAGRVFYAGFNGSVIGGDARSPNLSNYIFFSQLVKNKKDFTKCYQAGDPTSRENNDLVDTDGGFVRISGMDTVVGMMNLGSHLIVIATNGVWSISGGSDYGFTPTNLKVDKLSTFGGIARDSIVEHLGRAFYWGEDGIFVVSKGEFGEFSVNSITETTIQTLYEEIDTTSKQNVVGVYDTFGKKIRWVYKVNELFTSNSQTFELVLDTVINAFYRHRIYNPSDNSAEVVSILPGLGRKSTGNYNNILAGVDNVISALSEVVTPNTDLVNGVQQIRYLVLDNRSSTVSFSFAYYHNEDFRDWPHIGTGTDAFAYLLTGETTGGDSSIPKQLPYVSIHFYRTEEGVTPELIPDKTSGCLMRFRWEWSDTANSKKWSSLQQVYRYRLPRVVVDEDDDYDTGFKLITTKNKIRGRGKAFSMYLETEPFKDCQIVGWNLTANANTVT